MQKEIMKKTKENEERYERLEKIRRKSKNLINRENMRKWMLDKKIIELQKKMRLKMDQKNPFPRTKSSK